MEPLGAMSPEELPWLQDVYMSVGEDYDQQETSYILQCLWRDLTSEFDVIGPYFTCANSCDHKFLLECLMRTISPTGFWVNLETQFLSCSLRMFSVGNASKLRMGSVS